MGTAGPTSAPVMGGGKLRPLRLVQENHEDSAEREAEEREKMKAKRGSWMGWFNKGKVEEPSGGVAIGGVLGKEVVRE